MTLISNLLISLKTMNIEKLRKWIVPNQAKAPEPIPPGLYHYLQDNDGLYTRFHLRVEPDGRGLLLANASHATRLSASGVIIAKGLLDERSQDEIVSEIKAGFKGADSELVQADLQRVSDIMNQLAGPQDEYPVANLDELNPSVFEAQLLAPLAATITLAEPDKIVPLLDRLWAVGIPHVTFQIPAEFEAAALVRAVERAEDLGMIAGVHGSPEQLSQGTLLTDLALAGVDHVTVVVAGDTAVSQQTLQLFRDIQANEVYPIAEIALIAGSLPHLATILTTLQNANVSTFSFFAIVTEDETEAAALAAQAMPQTADWVEEIADDTAVRFIWQPPVQHDPTLTLAEQIQQGPRSSGDVSVRIEADGEVIPPRGPYQSAGNILSQPWEHIWHNAAFTRYRERVAEPTRCVDCPGLALCAADCPREKSGWAYR